MFGLPLYLRNAAPSTPVKRDLNGPAYGMRKKRQKKREERDRKRRKNEGIESQNTILAVLDCEEQHVYFRFQVSYFWSVAYIGFQK